MNNREISHILFNIATLLERQQGNLYRIRRYRNVARAILRLRHQLSERALAGQELGIPHLGQSLQRKITNLAAQGQLDFYEELCADLPIEQQRLIKVPGIGPILAERICDDLGTADLARLLRESAEERLKQIWGIGPQRSKAILHIFHPDDSPEPPPAATAHGVRRNNVITTQPTLWDYGLRVAKKAA